MSEARLGGRRPAESTGKKLRPVAFGVDPQQGEPGQETDTSRQSEDLVSPRDRYAIEDRQGVPPSAASRPHSLGSSLAGSGHDELRARGRAQAAPTQVPAE